MGRCARRGYKASLLVLSLVVSPSVYAAAENPPADKPAQAAAAPDDKSYLPPWMRGEPTTAALGAPLREGAQAQAAQPAQTLMASDARKAKGADQAQRRRQNSWPGGFFFRGVADFFGR
jgi:hypothetical protein